MRPAAGLALLALVGCGYGLAGRAPTVAAEAQSITIRLFRNSTRESGLEVHLRRAIADEFRRRSRLRIVESGGDLVLSGVIRRFSSVPVAFSATDEAVQYQGVMEVSLRLAERGTGHTLFETPSLVETQDFGAVSNVVITGSPHFQRGTINGRDLVNLTNVQIGAARRREALRGLIDLIARDVYQRTMEGF